MSQMGKPTAGQCENSIPPQTQTQFVGGGGGGGGYNHSST